MADGSVIIDIAGNSEPFKKALSGLGGVASSALKGVTAAIGAVSAGLSTAGGFALKVGMDFEAGMSQVAATMGITVDEIAKGSNEFESLKQAAKDMGASTQFSATQASEALNYLALAGYDAEKSITALPTVLNLAAAGGLDLGYASDLVTDSMSALGLKTEDLEGFVDELSKTSQKSNTNISQLGEAILTVGGTAKNLAGGTVELNTALGILADNGIKGAEGGTALRNVILAMTPTTDKAIGAFKRLNVSTYDAQGNLRPLNDIFGELNVQLSQMSQEERTRVLNDIFNKVDLKSASALLAGTAVSFDQLGTSLSAAGVPAENLESVLSSLSGGLYDTSDKAVFVEKAMSELGLTEAQAETAFVGLNSVVGEGASRFDELSEMIENSTGSAKAQADTLNNNLKGSIEILKSALEGLGIEFYENIDNPAKEAVEAATGYIDQLNTALKEGGTAGLVQEIGAVFADASTQIAAAVPAIIDSAVTVIQFFLTGVQDNLPQMADAAIGIVTSLVNGIITVLPQFLAVGGDLIMQLGMGLAQSLPSLLDNAANAILTLLNGFSANIPQFIGVAVQIIAELATGLGQALPQLIPAAVAAIMALVNGLLGNLEPLIGAALQLIMGLADGIVQALPQLIGVAPQIISQIVTALLNNLPELAKAALEILGALASGLLAAVYTLRNVIPQIFWAIADGFEKADWATIGANIISGIAEGLSFAVNAVLTTIKAIGTSILNVFKDLFGIHSPSTVFAELGAFLIQGLINGISGLIQAVVDTFVSLGQNILTWAKTEIPNFVTTVVTFISELPGKVWSIFLQFIAKVKDWTNNIINWVKIAIPQFVSTIIQFISELPGKIWNIFLQIIAKVKDWTNNIISWIKTAIPEFVNNIVNFISQLPSKIWNVFLQVIAKVKDWTNQIISWIKTAIPEFVNNIINFISQLPGKIWEQFLQVIQRVKDWTSQIISWVSTAIPQFVNNIVNNISGLPGKIAAKLGEALNKVKSWTSDLISTAGREIPKFVSNVLDEMGKLPGKVFDIGKSLVDKLWDGISSVAGNLYKKIQGFVDNIFSSAQDQAESKSSSSKKSSSKSSRDTISAYSTAPMAASQTDAAAFSFPTFDSVAIAQDMQTAVNEEVSFAGTRAASVTGYSLPASAQETTVINNKPVLQFYQPVESPAQTAQAVKRTMRSLVYG